MDHSEAFAVTTSYVPVILLAAITMPWLWVNIHAAGQGIRAIWHRVRRQPVRRDDRLLDHYGRVG